MFTTKDKRFSRISLKLLLLLTFFTLYAVPAVLAGGSGSPTPTGV